MTTNHPPIDFPKQFRLLTRDELVALTEEQIGFYVRSHLMHDGLVEPLAPVAPGELATPIVLPKVSRCEIVRTGEFGSVESTGILFRNADDAEAFCATARKAQVERSKREYDLPDGCESCVLDREFSWRPVEVVEEHNLAPMRDALRIRHKMAERHERAMRTYREECAKVSKVRASIMDKIRDAREAVQDLEVVRRDWAEYLGLCNQDANVAIKFLRKRHQDDDVVREALGADVFTALSTPPTPVPLHAVEAAQPAAAAPDDGPQF